MTSQIVSLIRAGIDGGGLAPGAKLPTTRQLAHDAGVNHLTVVRAYKRLAAEGFVTAARGRGTFVRQTPPGAQAADSRWQHAILPAPQRSSANQIVAESWRPTAAEDHVDLALGWSSPELHPVRELSRISSEVWADGEFSPMMYGEPEGLWPLREHLASWGAQLGFATEPEEILITTGARQGIDLVCRTVLRPGDVAVTESPTFMGTLISLQNSGARVMGVPYDEEGLDVDALERILARHEVKLVAVQTASQNPTGQDLSPQRAERLLALARERSFFVMEDGVYSAVRFGSAEPSRLRSRAPDHVIYIDSVSKTMGGGLRVGWLAAGGEVRRRLAELKFASDYQTSVLPQLLAERWLVSGARDRHLRRTNVVYAKRSRALMESVDRRLGDEVLVREPRGGHHIWLEFRRPLDERPLMTEALRHGVSFTPGGATTVEGDGQAGLRLSFSLLDEPRLDEGVRRLAAAVRAARRGSGLRVAPALS